MYVGPGIGTFASLAFITALYRGWLPFSWDANALAKVVLTVIAAIIFFYTLAASRLNLFHRVTGMKSSYMPVYVSRLGFSDTLIIIFLVLFKYPCRAVGLVSNFKTAEDGKHVVLPELRLDSSIQIDESDVKRYALATKSKAATSQPTSGKKHQPENRLLLLPALTTPMMLILMANRYNPVLPFGSVNTKNRFEFLDPEACRDPTQVLDLGPKARVVARLGGSEMLGRRVKRGVEMDIVVEMMAPRKGDTEVKAVFRQVITILAFLPKSAKPHFDETQAAAEDEIEFNWAKDPNGSVDLALSSPNKWAAVCNDYNPIHMSSLLAKLFGFPAKIAHGNHVVAGVIEELQDSKHAGIAERGLKNLIASNKPYFLEVQFKRPMILPTELVIRHGSSKDLSTYSFKTEKGTKEYVTGHAGQL